MRSTAWTSTVNDGEILGLIGPNGSGKTTLFNVVTGIYGADEGAVTFAGNNMTAATPQAIYRAGITRTFQRSRCACRFRCSTISWSATTSG